MKNIFLISIALCCTVIAQAQTKMTTPAAATEINGEPSATERVLRQSPQVRTGKDFGGFLSFSPFDLIIPNKLGASFYFSSADKMNQYEFQYLQSVLSSEIQNIDIAKMSEQKFTFLNRYFSSGSNFNWYYGLSYSALEVQLGDSYLNSVPANSRPSAEAIKVQVIALDLGVGNRWYFENGLVLGIDWAGFTQPISTLKKEENFSQYSNNQTEKDDLDKFLNFTTSFPRLYVLKLQLGYSF